MASALEASGITKSFGGVKALKGVSLKIQPGEVHGLVGENGAGKSTLIRIFSGVLRPDSGRVLFFGRPVEITSPRVAMEIGISTVYQEPSFYPDLSVVENMFMGRELRTRLGNVDFASERRRAIEQFRIMDVDPSLADERAGLLTLGQLQLMLIAKALLHDSKIIILDEPTGILTAKEADNLFRIVRTLKKRGISIVYISHRLEEVFQLTDRVSVMRDGEILGTFDTADLTRDRIVELMVGRTLSLAGRKTQSAIGGPILQVEGLGSPPAFYDVSFELRAGEILGFFGLVGSGRTEVAQAVAGIRPAQVGRIRLAGRQLNLGNPHSASALGVAYVPEDRKTQGLFGPMTVRYNISVGSLKALSRLRVFVDERKERSLALGFVRQFEIKAGSIDSPINSLSGGNQQKTVLARWLARAPKVLILDEPTRGVDVGAKEEIHRRIFELADAGVAVMVISSELPEVMKLSDRIVVMHEGHLTGVFVTQETGAEAVLRAAIGEGAGMR